MFKRITGARSRGDTPTLPSLSLRNKLLLFAATLVLLPGVLFGVIAERSGRDSLQVVIGRALAREAGHSAERLSDLLYTERETLRSFARQDLMREIRVADIDKRVSLALATLRGGSPARIDYLVVDAQHQVVASSNPSLLGDVPAWAEPGEAAPSAVERLWRPVSNPGAEIFGLVMATPIPDPDDDRRVLGTLVGLFDSKLLTAVTENVRQDLAARGIAAEVVVARSDGSIVAGARSLEERQTAGFTMQSSVTEGVGNPAPDYVVDASAGFIVGRASLAPELPDWKLLVVEPLSHAFAPARRLAKRLAFTMGLALVAALAVATLAARRVVRPLSELTLAIRDLPRGDPGVLRVPVRTEDEVGALGAAFNRMASELDRAQRDLVEAEKFAFLGELASGVAHEVRTSLGVLRSSAQILERSLPAGANAQQGELAQMIRAEVDRLTGVVNDLLTLDRPRALRLEAAPLSMPVLRAVDFVEPQAREKSIRVERETLKADPLVLCDPEMVYQVCVNLLVNAIEAVDRGGAIAVRILPEKDGYAGFEVWDDGAGIPEALRDKIFNPFVTAREGGVGLGLTFVKRVIHDHQGRVSVESGPGRGTSFRIELPGAGRSS